jgi:hypothetical protein
MAPNDFFNGLLARAIHEALPRSSYMPSMSVLGD